MKAALPILPTSVVGSHAKMGWWYLVRQEAEARRMGPRDVAEALDTAVDIAVLDQERAGVDVISDGKISAPNGLGIVEPQGAGRRLDRSEIFLR
jgi:5-methyltetrahydropteroyltriglutamate--homocysteine methyltransferase